MVKAALALLLAAVVAPLPTAAGAAPRPAAAAARDWSRTAVMTPQGGVKIGSPSARVRLIEYGSLACPHCRDFEQSAYGSLIGRYVRSGRVSYEYRNLMLNTPDIAVSLLARCGGPGSFFQRSHLIYATQRQWQAKMQNISDGNQAILEAMSPKQQVLRYAQIGGLFDLAARMGMSAEQAKACLTDGAQIDRLADMTGAASDAGVRGTPTFFINGKLANAATWSELEPLIRRAGG